MLIHFHKSTGVLTATLTPSPATGATVTVTIVDSTGTELVTDATMVDQDDDTYDYTIMDTLLPDAGRKYIAKITAALGGSKRYAEIQINDRIDTD